LESVGPSKRAGKALMAGAAVFRLSSSDESGPARL
jgi:hypothetical protein